MTFLKFGDLIYDNDISKIYGDLIQFIISERFYSQKQQNYEASFSNQV